MTVRTYRLLALAAATVATLGLGAAAAAEPSCQPGQLAAKYPSLSGKTLKVAISGANKPFSYRDPSDPERITGLDGEYARAIFACIGAPMTFSTGAWPGLLPSVVAGQADLMWDQLYYTPERAKSVDYVIYMVAGSGVVVTKGNPQHIHSLDDLCGKRAVSQLGSVEVQTLARVSQSCTAANKGEVAVTVASDRAGALRTLETDRADAYVGIGEPTAYDPALFEIVYRYNSGIKVGVGVSKGNAELERAIFDAFTVLKADGEEKKIFAAQGITEERSLPTEILTQ